jgi:hypothetical protein
MSPSAENCSPSVARELYKASDRKLTAAETRVLKVLCNPDYFGASNADRIAAANTSERRFYQIMADKWFVQQQKEAVLKMIQGDVSGVVNAALQSAKLEGRAGHSDRKMLLQMAGIYEPKETRQLTGPKGGPIETKSVGLSGLLDEARSASKS